MSVHDAVVGGSGSGKSTLVRTMILPGWRKQGIASLILDPVCQGWGAAPPWIVQTPDPLAFLEMAKKARRAILVIDECSQHIGLSAQLARELSWLATVSRNNGHKAYFIGQRLLQIPPSFRGQCGAGWIFRQAADDAEEACNLWGLDRRVWIPKICALPELHCYRVMAYAEPRPVLVPPPKGWRPIDPRWKRIF